MVETGTNILWTNPMINQLHLVLRCLRMSTDQVLMPWTRTTRSYQFDGAPCASQELGAPPSAVGPPSEVFFFFNQHWSCQTVVMISIYKRSGVPCCKLVSHLTIGIFSLTLGAYHPIRKPRIKLVMFLKKPIYPMINVVNPNRCQVPKKSSISWVRGKIQMVAGTGS